MGNWERWFLADEVTNTWGRERRPVCLAAPGKKGRLHQFMKHSELRRLHFILIAVESHWEGQLGL